MKEFVEKLIGRLEESRKTALNKVKLPIMIVCKHDLQEFVDICFEESKNIVNQLAEEYNNDFCEWKPTSEDLLNPYESTCGKIALVNPLWSYCPYCGKKIKVVE